MSHLPANYELVIRPTRGWFHLNLGDLWRYRDLLFLLVHRDFVAKYKQTILGPAWFILQPLLTTLVFTVIFGKVAKIPTDGLPLVLFYLAGLLGWSYFAQTFQTTSGTLIANAHLFGKVYFPRLVVPLSAVISNLLAFSPSAWDIPLFLGILQILHRCRRILRLQQCNRLASIADGPARSAQPRRWPLALSAHGKISRLRACEWIHHSNLDVCHAGDLSSVPDPREVAVARRPQPHDDAG